MIVSSLLQELMVAAIHSFHPIDSRNGDGNPVTEVEDENLAMGCSRIFEVMILMVLLMFLIASHPLLALAFSSLFVHHGDFLPTRILYFLFDTAGKAEIEISPRNIWIQTKEGTIANK